MAPVSLVFGEIPLFGWAMGTGLLERAPVGVVAFLGSGAPGSRGLIGRNPGPGYPGVGVARSVTFLLLEVLGATDPAACEVLVLVFPLCST